MKTRYAVPLIAAAAVLSITVFARQKALCDRPLADTLTVAQVANYAGCSENYASSCLANLAVLARGSKTGKKEEAIAGQPLLEGMGAKIESGRQAEIDVLYDRVNKYANLTAEERAQLDKDVKAAGDEGLNGYYGDVKRGYSGTPTIEKPAVPEQPTEKVGATPAGTVPASKPAAEVDALYEQVNRYAELDEAERVLLETGVKASGDSGLIYYYNSVKASYSGTPAVEREAPTPAETEGKPGKVPEVPQNLKDSLDAAVNECYRAINAMQPQALAQDSASIAGAIAGIEKVMGEKFPEGDRWAEYTLLQLKEYFGDYCRALAGMKE